MMFPMDFDDNFFQPPKWQRLIEYDWAAEYFWHFVQGMRAIDSELYIPGVLSLLAGIETSIRSTLHRIKNKHFPFEGDLGTLLSNGLLREARDAGMPVQLLAFPDEPSFLETLNNGKSPVRLVTLRNDLAHGNVQKFINRELGDELALFTPECLRDTAVELEKMSFSWMKGLDNFRKGASSRVDSL